MTVASTYWGPHFPDAAGGHYWWPHFPDGAPGAGLIVGVGPAGAATFVLDLENGGKVTYSWGTDVRKMYSGTEQRAQPLDDPRQVYGGSALLVSDALRTTRARLARFAAIGSAFLLALPFEALSISGPASGAVIPTESTANSDWMVLGQRVVVADDSGAFVAGVIQAFASNSVTLDVAPGSLGRRGAAIVPCMPIYLDPQQTFIRHPTPNGVESWQLKARAAVFGFQSDARKASASLAAASGALHQMVVSSINTGPAGNSLSITFVADGVGPGSVTIVGSAYTYHYQAGVTTVLAMLFSLGAVFQFTGYYDPAAVLVGGDAIGPVALANGADKDWGTMGRGASVTMYDSRPVWDRGVQVVDAATDSLQSLSDLLDLGGIPLGIGTATASDWGRDVMLDRTSIAEWQWFKAFLAAVRGRQRAWWYPTFRPDLLWAGSFGGLDAGGFPYMKIIGPSDAAGGLDAWWPSQRDRLMIAQADGTVTYVQIAAVIDNHDGTLSVSVLHTFSGSPITMISWVDLCHFEDDDFGVTFDGADFSFHAKARAVRA